jgi:hypothetical protein
MVEENRGVIEEWLSEYSKQRGQTGWTGRSGWLNGNNKLMTSLISIISGEFVKDRTYVISGMLKSVIKESELHVVIRQPDKKEYVFELKTDKEGHFYAEIISDNGGNYIISVEYNGRTRRLLKSVEVSLMVAVLEIKSFEGFITDEQRKRTTSIHI